MGEIIYKEESYAIQGAVFEVYRQMGSGFLEMVYQECLQREFMERGIPFEEQKQLDIFYKGQALQQKYIPDFACYDKIIVELKAAKETTAEHEAQLFNYLKATGYRLGLLVNFGHFPKATVKRIAF